MISHGIQLATSIEGFMYIVDNTKETYTVLLLAPCYSFPGHSYLHSFKHDINLLAVDCSPSLSRAFTQSDQFESSPSKFYEDNIAPHMPKWRHSGKVVALTFDVYWNDFKEYFHRDGLFQVRKLVNMQFISISENDKSR